MFDALLQLLVSFNFKIYYLIYYLTLLFIIPWKFTFTYAAYYYYLSVVLLILPKIDFYLLFYVYFFSYFHQPTIL